MTDHLTTEDRDHVIRLVTDPDDSCAHNFAPLFEWIAARVAAAEQERDQGFEAVALRFNALGARLKAAEQQRDEALARIAAVEARAADEHAAKKVAAGAADRFRDVLSEALGYEDENPGDDVLVATLREHFGKTGPEPTRWRDFCAGALAVVDQIAATPDPGRV